MSDELLAGINAAVIFAQGIERGHKEGHACQRMVAELAELVGIIERAELAQLAPKRGEVSH